jgi:hypothetical protein
LIFQKIIDGCTCIKIDNQYNISIVGNIEHFVTDFYKRFWKDFLSILNVTIQPRVFLTNSKNIKKRKILLKKLNCIVI